MSKCPACNVDSDHRYDRGAIPPKYLCMVSDCRVKVFEGGGDG